MEPKWLHGGDGYLAIIIDFLENSAALIEFEKEIEFDGFTGKYGLLELRYADQTWETGGPIHVTLLEKKICSTEEKMKIPSKWMESHASCQIIQEA